MRTRSAVAGLIVAVVIGGLCATPVQAEGETGGAEDPPATTETTSSPPDTATAPSDTPADPPPDADPPPAADPPPIADPPPDADPPPAADPPPIGGDTTDPPTSGDPGTPSSPPTSPPPAPPADGPGTTGTTTPTTTSTTAPTSVSSQDATVDAASGAVADTGHNTAANGAVQVVVVDQEAAASGDGSTPTPTTPSAGNSADGDNSGVGLALVVTGNASAVGGTTDDTISQKALVKAVGTGDIEIIQIALVVNLGVAVANTGGNDATGLDAVNVISIGQDAAAGPGGTGGLATNGLTAANDATGAGAISTGDAVAVGNANDVRVVQAADVAAGGGIVSSGQAADIASLGVAFGNTGLNIVIGNTVLQLILVDQSALGGSGGSAASASNQATATNTATGLAGITTGAASATGNASSTAIDQLAAADAGDGGFVSILQRALVLNLGIALANSGMNTAVGNQSVNVVDLQQQSIAGAFWASLQSLFGGTGWLDLTGSSGTTANSITAANTSDGAALVTTGNATATGLASSTEVSQTATGSASAGGQALVTQDATVTNGGLAIANSGANAAAGLLALNAVVADQWAGLGAYLSDYLAQLGTGSALAEPSSSSWALGDVLVDLFGEIHADEVLIDGFAGLSGGAVEAAIAQALGFPAGFDDLAATGTSATGPRIRVRQVTGTLTINLGIAATGGNTAQTSTVNVVVVDQQSEAASDSQVSAALGQGLRAAVEAFAGGTLAGDTALDPANLAVLVNATTGSAVIVTGDATARNATVIAVCQTYRVSPAVCSPPAEPPNATPIDPASPVPAIAAGLGTPGATSTVRATGWAPGRTTATTAGTLPWTGTDTAVLVRGAVVLLVGGMALVALAGRRRRHLHERLAGARIRL